MKNGKKKLNNSNTEDDDCTDAKKIKIDNDSNTVKVYPKRKRTPSAKSFAGSVQSHLKQKTTTAKTCTAPETTSTETLLGVSITNLPGKPGSSTTENATMYPKTTTEEVEMYPQPTKKIILNLEATTDEVPMDTETTGIVSIHTGTVEEKVVFNSGTTKSNIECRNWRSTIEERNYYTKSNIECRNCC